MTNYSSGVATVNQAYLAKNQNNSYPLNASLALGMGEQVLIGDTFFNLLGLDSANGGILVKTSHPDVKVTSRTYNAAGQEGTYGQFIPAQREDSAVMLDTAGGLNQLQENDDFRTNIGMVNLGTSPCSVSVQLVAPNGSFIGSLRTLTAGGRRWIQEDDIFTKAGAGNRDAAYARVEVATLTCQAWAYASVIDQATGDPTTLPVILP